MLNSKSIHSGAALATAIGLAAGSFFLDRVTGNILLLVAQFLLYSLTLLGFGEIVKYIIKITKSQTK